MADIVERLQSHMYKADMSEVLADCRNAADEIAALRARCEKAEAERDEAKASRDLQARIASDEEGLSRAAESRCEELVKALEPFSKFAAPVFERNFNNDDPVDTITASDGEQVTLFARDYFAARAAISSFRKRTT